MGKLLRLAMVFGGWRLLDRLVDRWADRGMSGNAADRRASGDRRQTLGARPASRQRSRKSRVAIQGVRVLSSVLRRMR